MARPIANTPQRGPQIVPFSSVDHGKSDHWQPHKPTVVQDDPSRWSSSQLSELRPRDGPPPDHESVVYESAQGESAGQPRQRANSFSTISEKQSVSGAGKRGELRIVIDRPEDRPKSADGKSGKTILEVPIPHYRLGLPRFNTEGSAFLQSSGYTRSSMSDNFRNSTWLGSLADPMPAPLTSQYARDSFHRNRSSFAVSMFSGTAAIDLSQASPLPRNSMVYELKGPVEPSIYENLVLDMDGGTVVRYIPGTKDISAATPARIVAQISSESFMDYELVSDFFLTFRSYLSPGHLLALLLARLQWAINRLQDDGRIIRIRTFAALRHWILNYFVDDFVANYDLRTHFCDTINALYAEVKRRQNGGMSDLKILLDLKRCWNGKCSVYWVSADLSRALSDPDGPVVPGSPHIELSAGDAAQEQLVGPASGAEANNRDSLPATPQHERNESAATVESIPMSIKSEQSVQALSCSLPPRSPRRLSFGISKEKAPRPVHLALSRTTTPQEPPPTSPMISRHPFQGHGHKRSGSFSDSVRDDRLPVYGTEPASAAPATQEILDPVSFIRGELYAPSEAFVTMMAPPSPPLAPPSTSSNQDRRSTPDGGAKPVQSSSGVKTIIGSIKRALHTRNGGQSVSARIVNASEAICVPPRGKTSAVPHHVALGSEFYREKKMIALPKRPARVDLLCDEVLKHYRQVLNGQQAERHVPSPATPPGPQNTLPRSSMNTTDAVLLQTPKAVDSSAKNRHTNSSESVVVVDDTGFDFTPAMSGATPVPPSNVNDCHSGSNSHDQVLSDLQSHTSSQSPGEYSLPMYADVTGTEIDPPLGNPQIRPPSQRRSYSTETRLTPQKTSLSLRLRKYASFQSGFSKHRQSMSSDATRSVASSGILSDSADKPAWPALRRRPGGNLRQIQYVDELEPSSTPVSVATFDGSLAGTTTTTGAAASRPQSTLIPPNPRYSLVQAGPNRNVRRSFESAIARFAQIPDDDDGGVESTLLKLEGKWPFSPPPQETKSRKGLQIRGEQQLGAHHGVLPAEATHVAGKADYDAQSRRRQTDKSVYSNVGGRLAPPRPYSDSLVESEESYNSIPLLERGLTDESMKRPSTDRPRVSDTNVAPLSMISSRDTSEFVSSHPSIQIVQDTESIRQIPLGSTVPGSANMRPGQSTRKHLSALSSDIDVIDSREATDGRLSTDTRSLTASTVDIPTHPLAHPPSPPMTVLNPGSYGSNVSPLDNVLFQAKPLTPDTSPRRQAVETPVGRPRNGPQFSSNVLADSENRRPVQDILNARNSDHVPFILACESQVLAQQLTLVEMAALSEIDWRDLVEMRWSSSSPYISSWAQFLATEDRKGIDLVVGRFNLMVKWVVSEIVLTRDMRERARTIIKYIHTAAHARRICNYATMLQIAIALSSSDCSRLQRTWNLVPAEDQRLFKDMECLIQPVRNFHDLRVQMETANLQEGCIPFIGQSQLYPSIGSSLLDMNTYETIQVYTYTTSLTTRRSQLGSTASQGVFWSILNAIALPLAL